MQKKALPIVVVAIAFLLLIGPVIAAPKVKNAKAGKTSFTNRVIIAAGGSSPGQQSTIGSILYVQGAISTGTIEADLSSPISGSVWTSLSGSVDLNTFLGSFNGKWTITNERGTFAGSVVGTVNVATVSGRFVGHGTGDFEGQRIRGSFQGSVNNYVVDLTIQGRISSR